MRQVWPFLAERQMAACTIGYLAAVVLANWQVIPWPLVAAVADALVLAGAEQALRNALGGPAAGGAARSPLRERLLVRWQKGWAK